MGTFINDKDRAWFNHIAQEVNCLAGVIVTIFQFDEENSEIDPLWNEEQTTVYKKDRYNRTGVECPAFFNDPNRSSLTGEEGHHLDKTTTIEFAQKDLSDRNIRRLRTGDIVKAWDVYWDIVESSVGQGQVSDSGLYSVIKFDVTRRTKGVPESFWRPGEDQ